MKVETNIRTGTFIKHKEKHISIKLKFQFSFFFKLQAFLKEYSMAFYMTNFIKALMSKSLKKKKKNEI